MPAGTPPNALIFGTGRISMGRFVRAGLVVDLLAILAIVAFEVELRAALGTQRAEHADVLGAGVAVVVPPVERQAVGAGIEARLARDLRRRVRAAARVAQQRDLVEVDRQADRHGPSIA